MALVGCILGKFLGVVCHCFPPIYIAGKQTSGLYWPQRDALKSFIIYWLGFPRYYIFYLYVQTPIILIPACESVASVSFLLVAFP